MAAAALTARLVTKALDIEPWPIASTGVSQFTTLTCLLSAVLGLVAGIAGVVIMRTQTLVERLVVRLPLAREWRSVLGGALLMPVAWLSPQALSAGHGAMHLYIALHPGAQFLAVVFGLKVLASIIALSFDF